jgi:MSHA biogenesis protein MshP
MTPRILRKSAGVALVTAIFLLVILAGLAVAVVSLTTTQQSNAAKDELGARAYQSAKAGMQWALYAALQPVNNDPRTQLNCATPITFQMPPGTTLSTFTVTVTCSAAAPFYGDGSANDPTARRFRITATACNGPAGAACPSTNPGPDYVQRVITAQL